MKLETENVKNDGNSQKN